ncbi:MAG: DNA gyrase C-terminal beta-propeller domain-containing protein, partial [Clostridium sp.]
EFETNNRMVAATKLLEGDDVIDIRMINEETEVVLQTSSDVFLRFPIAEVAVLKKNSRGVRGIKLGKDEELETVHLLGGDADPIITYKQKQVHLNRLKIGKRDGKGSKVRL